VSAFDFSGQVYGALLCYYTLYVLYCTQHEGYLCFGVGGCFVGDCGVFCFIVDIYLKS
jgi:hypothetical protein